MAKKNIFIVGYDDYNAKALNRLFSNSPSQAVECEFHPLLYIKEIRNMEGYDIEALIDKATRVMENFQGTVDGVACYYDFPCTSLVPILARKFGLPGASLEAVMKCENKYWSRLEQKKVVAEHIPQFRIFDPFDEEAYSKVDLLPPFWIKPIKSFRSFLAFQINSCHQFAEVMSVCREKIGLMAEPFHYLMENFDMPQEISQISDSFIAESSIGGSQCTLEGYVYDGQVTVYGVVDSLREQNISSFSRYQYPSFLPLEIQHRMMDLARLVVTQIGLDNSPFKIEFFYDQTSDQIWLLEINPRLSQSHSDIFEMVHGVSHFSVMADLALGRKPKPMERRGRFNLGAHFMLRTSESGRITRVPSEQAIEKLKQRQPGTDVIIKVRPGQHLSDLQGQDMYSYEIASVYIGGRDQSDILDKYDEALTALQFDIEKDEEMVVA